MKYLFAVLVWGILSWNVLAEKVVQVTKDVSNGATNFSVVTSDNPHLGEPSPQQIAKASTEANGLTQLHMAERLSYLTVQLDFKDKGQATGFFYFLPHPKNPSWRLPVIVSNRHATKDASETSFVLTLASNSLPTSVSRTITIDHRECPWIHHPDPSIDLSMLPIGSVLNELESAGIEVFIAPFDSSLIPDDDYMKSITQTDEVIMIGYPGGYRDKVNNQPIFRKGILATSPSKNFGGERKFLIDMPVYPGSSGSPVLLFSETDYLDRGGTQPGIHFAGRLKLLGINYATLIATAEGVVIQMPVPTAMGNRTDSNIEAVEDETVEGGTQEQQFVWGTLSVIPNNIGVVIQASCLKEMEAYAANRILGLSQDE